MNNNQLPDESIRLSEQHARIVTVALEAWLEDGDREIARLRGDAPACSTVACPTTGHPLTDGERTIETASVDGRDRAAIVADEERVMGLAEEALVELLRQLAGAQRSAA